MATETIAQEAVEGVARLAREQQAKQQAEQQLLIFEQCLPNLL